MKALKITIVLALLISAQTGFGQLLPQFSQYMFNDYVLNPAIGGTHDYWQIKTNYRYQWAGIDGAPQTYLLGAYGPHKRLPMGYGGYMFNDITGPISNMGIYGSYSYSIRLSGDIRLSMGLFAGVVQQSVDLSALQFGEYDNISDLGESKNTFYPDGSLGLYLYTSQYFVGFSFNHLLFNNLSILDDFDYEDQTATRIKPHLYLQGGYKYNLNRNFDIVPAAVFKYVPNYDFITDVNIRTIYQKLVWAGVGFRYNFKNPEALIFLVGYNYNDVVNIGYSYDFTMSKLSNASNGSHEVMIGVKFNEIRQSRSRRKIR